MSFATGFLNQFRKPSGLFGRLNARVMNLGHSRLTDWGLKHVPVGRQFTILDVGCGGGRSIRKLAAMAPEGRVFGVDHSEASVTVARRMNQREVESGRVEIRQASVSELPFADGVFDVVTAIETHFYWPDLPADLEEVRRVLKPGGTILLVAETYKGGKKDRMLQQFAHEMGKRGSYSHLTVDEHRDALSKAGYASVEVDEDYDKNWICVKGKKPAPA